MATVTMEQFGQQLEGALGDLGVPTRLLRCEETPQQYVFDFSGGAYRSARLKSAMDFLNNRDGLTYEKHTNGGFTVIKQKAQRDFITFDQTAHELANKVNSTTNGKQKAYLCFGKGAKGYLIESMETCRNILIAGSAGSGKSCLLNSLIMQTLCFSNAEIMLIDTKRVELNIYERDVHNRIYSVAKTAQDALQQLKWAEDVMRQRYRDMEQRNIEKYDGKRIIIFIDELADLMMTSGGEVEQCIVNIAQLGRASGIHLIIATQNPLARVVTSLIKGNLQTKICLQTANARHSMNVIDVGKGATLLDKGDAIAILPDSTAMHRIQCPYITRDRILNIITKRTV